VVAATMAAMAAAVGAWMCKCVYVEDWQAASLYLEDVGIVHHLQHRMHAIILDVLLADIQRS